MASLIRMVPCALVCASLLLAPGAGAQEKLESQEEKTLYAIGFSMAASLKRLGLDAEQYQVLESGLADGVLDRDAQVDLDAQREHIQPWVEARMSEMAAVEKQKSQAFLDEATSKEGAVKTDSGLVFVQTEEGSGESPVASDTVRVHYRGTLRDATEFDSSHKRGQPARFQLDGVIDCWTEALQKMKPGGKATLYCPPDLAYGDQGTPDGRIPGGAALRFEVELLEVVE